MRSTMILLLALGSTQPSLSAQSQPWKIDRKFTSDLDIRQPTEESAKFGLDFNVGYRIERTRPNPQGNHFGLTLGANGYQDFGTEVKQLNQMVGEIAFQGRYYSAAGRPLRADLEKHFRELLDIPTSKITPKDSASLVRLIRSSLANRQFFTYDAHYRYETTQDVDTSQHALGVALSGEVPGLHRALDALAATTRSRRSNFRVQPVRAYLAFDYVVGEEPLTTTDDNRYPRASLETAWSTLVFNDFVLRATWLAQYIFSAPETLKARDRQFNSLVQVWAVYPVSENVGLLIKYVDGRMPPTYDSSSVGKAGFSISFQ